MFTWLGIVDCLVILSPMQMPQTHSNRQMVVQPRLASQAPSSITLSNVLVPDFHHNLFSISKFTKDHNCFVTLFPRFCVFQDLSNEKIMGIGIERHRLYYLDNSSLQSSGVQTSPTFPTSKLPLYKSLLSAVNNIKCSYVSHEHLWHQRLGHIS